MIATEIIKKKRNKLELTFDEITFFISGYTRDEIPDYQMSALLMAILLNGMTPQETIDLTQIMLDSGDKIIFDPELFPVDKHSTGGVGDKTSLILAPIVAACGLPVPMMSGRGLGHTGGTLDKLESIPGFNISISLEKFRKIVAKNKLCFIGQTKNICPADKKIYSLRDVTATVESLPLICASIMSKKIAEGIRGLVLDVKVGSGAFMKTLEDARQLATSLVSIGRGHNIETKALLSNMNQPLGVFSGNSLEVNECLSILKRQDFLEYKFSDFKDTESLSLDLAANMISIGKKISLEEARIQALNALNSGQAYEKFAEICQLQSGRISELPQPSKILKIKSPNSGYLKNYNTELIGVAGISLGAGRKLISDKINPVAGIEIHKKIGDKIEANELLFTIHTDDKQFGVQEAENLLNKSYLLSEQKTDSEMLILLNL
jgi:pyrimidine-nucleoside phosphorylase